MDRNTPSFPEQTERRNTRVAGYVLGAFLFMLGASYAAVPLYDMFCRTTGFAGTPLVAKVAPKTVSDRLFTIRFDANVAPDLNWKFTPEVETITLRAGEVKTVGYTVKNDTRETMTAIASYNVLPEQTGGFFNKLSCFCFTDVTLAPGEARKEEVVFFIDPAISDEHTLDLIKTITLSYTFYRAKTQSKPLADAGSRINPPAVAGEKSSK